jgi:hypothetical protein
VKKSGILVYVNKKGKQASKEGRNKRKKKKEKEKLFEAMRKFCPPKSFCQAEDE